MLFFYAFHCLFFLLEVFVTALLSGVAFVDVHSHPLHARFHFIEVTQALVRRPFYVHGEVRVGAGVVVVVPSSGGPLLHVLWSEVVLYYHMVLGAAHVGHWALARVVHARPAAGFGPGRKPTASGGLPSRGTLDVFVEDGPTLAPAVLHKRVTGRRPHHLGRLLVGHPVEVG